MISEEALGTVVGTGFDIIWWVGLSANVAAILTAAIAMWVWFWFRAQKAWRRKRLEEYLKDVKSAREGMGQRTVLHLMANLRMTEAQIFDAAFDSEHVMTVPGQDLAGIANRIYFEYTTGDAALDLEMAQGTRSGSPRPRAR